MARPSFTSKTSAHVVTIQLEKECLVLYLWNELISGRKKRGCLQSPEDPLTLWWDQNCSLLPYSQKSGGVIIPGDSFSSVYYCPGKTARLQLLSFFWCSKHTGFLSIQIPSWSLWIMSRDHIQMVPSIENKKSFSLWISYFFFYLRPKHSLPEASRRHHHVSQARVLLYDYL